jgi:DNA-binding NtrC family response regulator
MGSLSDSGYGVVSESGDTAANTTILIVAREPSVRSVTRRILERQSFRTLEARDVSEAIAVFHEHAREVQGVILDLGMPAAGADRVAGEFRRAQPALPILFTGSYGDDASSEGMKPGPTTGFLATPFGLDALAEKAGDLFGEPSTHGNRTDPAR